MGEETWLQKIFGAVGRFLCELVMHEYDPADWKGLGKSAGYKWNEQMAQNADALVAFWDGQSRGTKHMIDLACKYGLKVRVIKYE